MRRLRAFGAEIRLADELDQIPVSGLALGQQQDPVGRKKPVSALRLGAAKAEKAAHDRLHPGVGAGLGEFQRAEKISRVGGGDRGHALLAAQLGQFLDRDGALGKRIGGMDAKMDEVAVRHVKCSGNGKRQDSTDAGCQQCV